MNKIVLLLCSTLLLFSCGNEEGGLNIFSVDDDKKLGKQVDEEIMSNPDQYPVLNESRYPEAYNHINRILDSVLKSQDIIYRDKFDWQVRIIRDDSVLNAFAAPGGYLYFYTGLIKFLNKEDQLTGVMGHEAAHADRRHVTQQLTKIYGVQVLLSIILGDNQGVLADIAANLAFLSFSRDAEEEADEFSVIYLCPTVYQADGAADFFQRIDDSSTPPEFLSTHPNPGDRVEFIHNKADELNCQGTREFDERYQSFINSLP